MLSNNRNLLFKGIILALCIISCVHLFLFPLFETNNNSNIIRTYSDFEPTLCPGNIRKRKHLQLGNKCPQYGIITVIQGGRLGNQIWEYASVWAYARETGLEPYIPRCIKLKLETIFDKLTLPTFDEIGNCLVQPEFSMSSQRPFANSSLDAWNFTNQIIILPRYTMTPELISTWVQDIIQEFRIKDSLLEKSQKVLHSAVNYLKIPAETFIGVHVRRTDYIRYIKMKFDAKSVNPNFFKSAMDVFEKKFPSPIFIVVSDDIKWCANKFKFQKNVYVVGKHHNITPTSDLAILASCNHTIYDYGTFGQWGAILAGGETIYYNLSEHHSSFKFGRHMKNWHML